MTGDLLGQSFRVAGRAVMETQERGREYFWNEFFLANPSGTPAILVYELTEFGGKWQLFTRFEPENQLTTADADGLEAGDEINLDGTRLRITLKSVSQVRLSEGEVPQGYEPGGRDSFFNAEGGDREVVVSWRGEPLEWYRGESISYQQVRAAFGLRGPALEPDGTLWKEETSETGVGDRVKWVAISLLFGVLIAGFWFWPRTPPPPGRLIKADPAIPVLPVGSRVPFDGHEFQVQNHALVEIAEVGLRYQRHEYQLLDADGNAALLVQGTSPGGQEWAVYRPFEPESPLSPQQAAAMGAGQLVHLEGREVRITEIFRTTVPQTEGAEAAEDKKHFYYGISAPAGAYSIMARWDERGIVFYRGRSLPGKEVSPGLRSAR